MSRQYLIPGGSVINETGKRSYIVAGFGAVNETQALSTGAIQFVFNGNSLTDATVQAYNDGVINVPSFSVSSMLPIVEACRTILKDVGLVGGVYAARPYKLAIIRNGVTLFTIRSVYWGTAMAHSDTQPNYELIDMQTQAKGNSIL